ncbi:MAG: diguanylate cyclase [Pseudomonadota bacterium]
MIDAVAKPLVLVIDDQPANIQVLHALLMADFDVCMALNGEDALALCAARPPDLILLDIEMPGMGGYEVCRRLKADPVLQDIPVVFVTGHLDPEVEVKGFAEGGADFITKPFHANVVLARVRTQITLKIQSDFLRSRAYVDSLTLLDNRRRFDETLLAEWQRCRRASQPLALILADVDHFKRYNDHYGHQQGDACLRAVAATLRAGFVRSHDLVARYGGEEFACVLPDTTLAGAMQKAAAVEQAIRALAIPHADGGADGIITISLGVAVAAPPKGDQSLALLEQADVQLYRAKDAGRGRAMSILEP